MKAVTFPGVGDVGQAERIPAVRAGGAVSSVGVYVETTMGFPAREAFFKNLTPHGYAIFDRKEDRAIKVMLRP